MPKQTRLIAGLCTGALLFLVACQQEPDTTVEETTPDDGGGQLVFGTGDTEETWDGFVERFIQEHLDAHQERDGPREAEAHAVDPGEFGAQVLDEDVELLGARRLAGDGGAQGEAPVLEVQEARFVAAQRLW